jgi:pyrroline-5-carboxylate reductase
MGGALLQGWRSVGAFEASDILICDPNPGTAADAAALMGARLNPAAEVLGSAQTVLLAVKPQVWREVAAVYAPFLSSDAVIVSIAAGIRTTDLTAAFDRPVARVMPTTAVEIAKGAATLFAPDGAAKAAARRLFTPVARVVEVEAEALIDAATSVSGSAPAYFYAFIEALEAAGVEVGLTAADSATLVRSTLIGAAALLDATGEDPAELRRQVTSKAGTTEAALEVLLGTNGLRPLLSQAVAAALQRAKALAG